MEKGDVQVYEGYQNRNDINLMSSPPQVRSDEEPSDYMKCMLTSQSTTSLPSYSINNDGGLSIKEENNDGDSDKVIGKCSACIIQRIWRGSRIRHNLTATERILIRTGGDQDHGMLHKAFRVMKKKVRQSISRSITGSGRRYIDASSIRHSPSIVVQRYVRRFLAKKIYHDEKSCIP